MNKAREAFARALDWLEANPAKHIAGRLATNGHLPVPTGSPEATCFCALGRFAYEMGINTNEIAAAAQPLIRAKIIARPSTVYDINDSNINLGQDKARVITQLRSLIA